jgi:hypothetical protein
MYQLRWSNPLGEADFHRLPAHMRDAAAAKFPLIQKNPKRGPSEAWYQAGFYVVKYSPPFEYGYIAYSFVEEASTILLRRVQIWLDCPAIADMESYWSE